MVEMKSSFEQREASQDSECLETFVKAFLIQIDPINIDTRRGWDCTEYFVIVFLFKIEEFFCHRIDILNHYLDFFFLSSGILRKFHWFHKLVELDSITVLPFGVYHLLDFIRDSFKTSK